MRALILKPALIQALTWNGLLHLLLGNYEQATKALEDVARVAPHNDALKWISLAKASNQCCADFEEQIERNKALLLEVLHDCIRLPEKHRIVRNGVSSVACRKRL